MMKRLMIAVLALAAAPAFAEAPEPACGTADKPALCFSLDSTAATVVVRGAGREYIGGGGSLQGPLGAGFAFVASADALASQDGGSLDGAKPQVFRAILLHGSVKKAVGQFRLGVHGGATFSIEGAIGAPVDAREWEAQFEAELPLDGGGHLALRGGHDGSAGGWALVGDIDVPVKGGPSIVARYAFPLQRDVRGRSDWVLTAGGRVHVHSWRLKLRAAPAR